MADETTTIETQKVFDITEGKFVERPLDKDPSPSAEGAQDGPLNKPPVVEPPPDTPPADAPPADPPPAAKPADKPPTDTLPPLVPETYLKGKFGEKYGIESEADLEDILASTDDLTEQYNDLKVKYEDLQKNPVYRDDQEKKIADFLKQYDPSKFGEGLKTVASIMAVDNVDNLSSRTALELAYVVSHPNLTEEEAKEMFADQHDKKYSLNKEDFDTDDAYNKRKRILDIQLKDEEAQAKSVLKTKKEELKAKPAEKPAEEKPTTQAAKEVPAETVEIYSKELDKFFNTPGKTFDRFNFLSEDKKDQLFSVVLDKAKIDDAKGFVQNFIKNPAAYNKEGKITKFEPQELVKTATRILHGDWLEAEILKNVKVLAAKLKAEQIAGTTPDKRSNGTGDIKLSIDDQFKKLAADEAANRSAKKR